MRIPYVISLRGEDVPGHVPGLQRIHALLAPCAGAPAQRQEVVANSESLAELSRRADPSREGHSEQVAADYFRPPSSIQPSRLPAFHVLYAGRLHSKGWICCIGRSRRFPLRIAEVVWLDVVGDGPTSSRAAQLRKRWVSMIRITWHGWRSKPESR